MYCKNGAPKQVSKLATQIAKLVAIGYCWLIQQTVLNSLLWSLVIKYFWKGCFAPLLLHLWQSIPISYATGCRCLTICLNHWC